MKINEFFLGEWTCRRDVECDFKIEFLVPPAFIAGQRDVISENWGIVDIAYVIFVDNFSDVYLVIGEDCSSLELEHQWLPTKINKKYLENKVANQCENKVDLAALAFLEIIGVDSEIN